MISQTGVSRILGPDYNHLDGEQKLRKDAFNHRTQQWVTLEYALFEWQQRAQLAKLPLSGQIIKYRMDINNFIEPKAEQVIDTDEDIDTIVLATIPQEHLEEADDEIVERPQISIRDALEALDKLTLYEETYSDGNPAVIVALAKYKKQLDERQRHHQQMLPQASLERWFITQS